MDEDGVPPQSIPTQGVFDPVGGRDITGVFVSIAREELRSEVEAIMREADERRERGENVVDIYNDLCGRIENAVLKHFNSLKLPPDMATLALYREELARRLGVEG